VQLSYSRRVRRPESDDLNPFPEYTDPYNIDSGNPRLTPEIDPFLRVGIHLTGDHFSFEPTLYFRDRRNGFTRLTQAVNDSTFLRTTVNLASDRSAGLSRCSRCPQVERWQANVSGNVFHDEIDASNLGLRGPRSPSSRGAASSTRPWRRGLRPCSR